MRNRLLILVALVALLSLVLLGCTMGGSGVASITATPTKTMRPLFTSTYTPTATPIPTDTPLPSATPLPATDTPLPTETLPPPTETATAAPAPSTEAPPTEAATDNPAPPTDTPRPAATNTPAPPTNTPKPQVDFVIKEIVAFEDGSLTASGFHNIYFTVIDIAGAPLDGIILEDVNNEPHQQVTSGNKGPGKTEFTMWAADYTFRVIGHEDGRTFSSETTHVLSVLYGHAVWDDLIRGGICTDVPSCEALGIIHYSYNVTFQRTW